MTGGLVARGVLQGWIEPEVDVHGLVAGRGRVGSVPDKGPERARLGEGRSWCAREVRIDVERSEQTRRHGLDVSLRTRYLSGEPDIGAGDAEGWVEGMRGIDEGVPVHHAVAKELCRLEPRDQAKDAPLLRPSQVCLKTHKVVGDMSRVLRP